MHPRVVDILACPIHNTFFTPLATPKLFARATFRGFLTIFYPQLWEKTQKKKSPQSNAQIQFVSAISINIFFSLRALYY